MIDKAEPPPTSLPASTGILSQVVASSAGALSPAMGLGVATDTQASPSPTAIAD